jgi:hypothetical protein
MNHFLQAVINFLMALHWPTILALLSSSAVVSVVAQLIKRFTKLERDGVIKFMVASLATLSTALQLILADPGALNMLGIYAAAAYALTQAIYPVVRYVQNWVVKVSAALNSQNNQPQDNVLITKGREKAEGRKSATRSGVPICAHPLEALHLLIEAGQIRTLVLS